MMRNGWGIGKRFLSHSLRKDRRELAGESLIGSLVFRGGSLVDETERFEKEPSSSSYKRFVIPEALKWTRMDDREAGDDEGLLNRSSQSVRDTTLFKARTSIGFAAVKTAGIDAIIDILNVNAQLGDVELLRETVYRVEYLAPTLSVKKIRLFLESLAGARGIEQLPRENIETMMDAVGHELLCRFHGITLLTCCSIAESMATIGHAKHQGLLNVLSIAYKKNIEEPMDELTDERIVRAAIVMLRSYNKMDHLIPSLIESALKSVELRIHALSPEDKLAIRELLFSDHMEALRTHGPSICSLSID
jgi:hypothetical protein